VANTAANGALNVCACGDIKGKKNHRGQTCAYRISDSQKTLRFFDLCRGPPHTSQQRLAPWRGLRFDCLHASAMEACPFRTSRHFPRARGSRSRPNMRRRQISGRRTEPDSNNEFSPGSTRCLDRHQRIRDLPHSSRPRRPGSAPDAYRGAAAHAALHACFPDRRSTAPYRSPANPKSRYIGGNLSQRPIRPPSSPRSLGPGADFPCSDGNTTTMDRAADFL